ncbi:MAG TPA: hypothetical protein DCY35_10535 [Prolixibacteraceae bacterium]|nr:hypothetical protein [Prolixibacteraceae bacterium]
MKNHSSKCMSRIFAIVLALAMTVPVSAMFSTNAIAETTDNTQPLAEFSDGDVILEDRPEIPTPPEVPLPENFKLPDEPPESPDNITYEEFKLPVFEHVEEPYNITLVSMESPTGPLYEGMNNSIQVILKNKANHNIKNINVEIYDQLDDGESVFLTDLFYGCIPKGKEQKKTFTWETEAGTHSLTLNISYMDNGVEQVNEEELGFFVMPEEALTYQNIEYTHHSYQGPYNDWTVEHDTTLVQRVEISPGEFRNQLILDEGQPPAVTTYIFFHQANIIVKNSATLILDGIQFPIICPIDGQYTITVENGGIMEVLGDSTITATSSLFQGYGFEVYGTLNVIGTPTVKPTIQWMYGDMGNENIPAGIQLYRDSDATFEYATIRDGESHNIYADGAEFTVTGCDISGAQSTNVGCGIYAINGAEMHIDGDTAIYGNGHSGIYSVTSSVDVDGATVSKNLDYGVAVIGDLEDQPGGGIPIDWWFEPWGSRPVVGAGAPCYDIWMDDSPDKNTWHVRWTGDGTGYTFDGIVTLDGPRTYIDLFGNPDIFSMTPLTMSFTDDENPIEEGFDFRFDGSKVIFDLQVSLASAPVTLVANIGCTGTNCEINPFRVYQMRPMMLTNFVISDVDAGIFIKGRASGQISGFDIRANDYQAIYLYSGARNNQISNGYAHSMMRSAIYAVSRSGNNVFHDLDLSTKYGTTGLSIVGSDNNLIQNVNVNLDPQAKALAKGFDFRSSRDNAINNCEASNCQYGLIGNYFWNNRITSFTATDCMVGMVLWVGNRNSLSSCLLNYNGGGLYALAQNDLSIRSISASYNAFPYSHYWTYGMVFDQCTGVTVTYSIARDNIDPDTGDIAAGIVALGSDYVSISKTETNFNDYGVHAQGCFQLKLGDDDPSPLEFTAGKNRQWGVALFDTSGNILDPIISSIASGIYVDGPLGAGPLQRLTIQGGTISSGGFGEYGIYAVNDANIKIQHSPSQIPGPTIITENKYGITILNSIAEIRDASITNNLKGCIDAISSTVKVFDSEIKDNSGFGIHLEQCMVNVEITGNIITGNLEPNWPGPEPQFSGIKVSNSNNVWIHDNPEIMGNSANIYIVNSGGVIVERNIIIDASAVIQIYPTPPPPRGIYSISSQITASNNMIWGTIIGIDIEDADSSTVISNNEFQPLVESPPNPAIGIRLNSASVKVERNTFDNIGIGIYCSYSSPLILDNEFTSCKWGIKSLYGAPLNSGTHGDGLVTDNTFSNDIEGDVIQYWWLQVHVEENGQGVSDEPVIVWELGGGEPCWLGFTGTDGNTEKINVVEYYWDVDGQQQHVKTPHLIMVRTELHPNIDMIDNWVEDFYFP